MDLLQKQMERESMSMADGALKEWNRQMGAKKEGQGTSEGGAGAAVKLYVEAVAAALAAPRTGPAHHIEKWCEILGHADVAYLALCITLDEILYDAAQARITTVMGLAKKISKALRQEARYRRLKAKAPGLFRYKIESTSTSNTAFIARGLDAAIAHAAIDIGDLEMDGTVAEHVGIRAIEYIRLHTSLIETDTRIIGPKQQVEVVKLTEKAHKWIDTRDIALQKMCHTRRAMIVPPVDWSKDQRGGYAFALKGSEDFVREVRQAQRQKIAQADMQNVYDAVNAMQHTAWSLNQRVLDTVKAVLAVRGEIKLVRDGDGTDSCSDTSITVTIHKKELPDKPFDIDTNEEARKKWRKDAHKVHEENFAMTNAARSLGLTLNAAEELSQFDRFFFPYFLDFRGRVYPIASHLTPQGDDLQKGLLQFADAKALGSEGDYYLAIHGANALGKTLDGRKLSKLSLNDRVTYVREIGGTIADIAHDPMAHLSLWQAADEPFVFLAFCFEWANIQAFALAGNDVATFPSRICVAMDGTCNGLQHFSGMLSDERGGKAVNLIPSGRPADIYQDICDVVTAELEQAASTEQMARVWLKSGVVNRSLTKRPTMTFTYGSKAFGFRKQIIEHMMGLDNWRSEVAAVFTDATYEGSPKVDDETGEVIYQFQGEGELLFPASSYMAKLIWAALQTVTTKAVEAMEFLQEAASAVVESTNGCVSWTVPGTNLPVIQQYMETKSKRIDTVLNGSLFRARVGFDTDNPNRVKQVNGVAPNVVHSLDAAVLQLTVIAAAKRGVTHFGMIHDSYGTHAGDAAVLALATRFEFVRFYTEHDVLAELRAQWATVLSAEATLEFPEVPTKGSLDLNQVLASSYFFS